MVPKKRSNISCVSAMVITAMAVASSTAVISVIQVKIGMRISRIPGARMLMIVTMKLIAEMIDEMPRICRPRT